MLCATCICLDFRGPGLLETLAILTFIFYSCSGHVFIHAASSLFSLPCSPVEMEVPNPTYRWVRDKEDSRSLKVSSQGHLLFKQFRAGESGNYSCTISYMEHGLSLSQTFHYSVLGYHILGGLETVLLFQSKRCEEKWTKRFLWILQDSLSQLAAERHCKFQLMGASCFPTLNEPLRKVFVEVQLQVSFFGPHWDEHCISQDQEQVTDCYHRVVQQNIWQVQLAMNNFFKEHKFFHVSGADIPHIIFTNNFVGFLETKHCNGGYGQTKQLQRCLDCCIVCPPGTFSPPKDSQCSPCPVGTYSLIYGMAWCTPCKEGLVTRTAGTSSMENCVEEGELKRAASTMGRIPVLTLSIAIPLLAIIFLLIFSYYCYWTHQEHPTLFTKASKRIQTTKVMEMMKKFFRFSKESPQGQPAAVTASATNSPDPSSSQKADMEQKHGVPSLTTTPNLADVTKKTSPASPVSDIRDTF
ncbi:zona pellucida-binding protein 2-like [Eudromia elegans]